MDDELSTAMQVTRNSMESSEVKKACGRVLSSVARHGQICAYMPLSRNLIKRYAEGIPVSYEVSLRRSNVVKRCGACGDPQ